MRRADLRRSRDDVEAGDARRALGRLEQRRQDADGGGLAGAVVAEQPEDGAGGDVEVEVAQRPEVAEALAEAGGAMPRSSFRMVVRCSYIVRRT